MAASVLKTLCILQLAGLIVCLIPLLEPHLTVLDDFVLVDFRVVPRGFSRSCYRNVTGSTKRSYNACVATLPTQIFANFSYELPKQGCGYLNSTSSTANYHKCTYATNAGFFDTKSGTCVGNVVSNGKVQKLTGASRANFGIVNGSYVIGYITNDTLSQHKFNFSQLLTGAGWLVRSGVSYINTSASIENLDSQFVNEKAPRTGICTAHNGTLIILQVDGEEDRKLGVDLHEFSDILVERGCWQAVNLDGGGSSTSVYKGKVINKPTCDDTPLICERNISSITCLK